MRVIERVQARALAALRKDQPEVIWPIPGLRFGNLLYMWLQAAVRQSKGVKCRVRDVPAADGWYEEFPQIRRDLVIAQDEVRFLYNRLPNTFQIMGKDHTADDVDHFCRRYLLPAPGIARFRESAVDRRLHLGSTVTVNVRRGDYYSVSEHRANYGFDVRGFVLAALKRHQRREPITNVYLVSDGIDWCESQLVPALRAEGLEVNYDSAKDGARDFAHLAWSTRLVLGNSTFSYWGGYMAVARSEASHVVAPAFHARAWANGRSFHLHPRWEILEGFDDLHDSAPLKPGE